MGTRKTILLFSLILAYHFIYPQSCQQNLADATRAYYNQGQLRQVEQLLQGCYQDLNKQDRISALKLLVNASLLLNEDEKAEQYMLQFLKTDPTYKIKEGDLAEFRQLYNEYKVISKFTIGVLGGFQRPDYRIIRYQSYSGDTQEQLDYDENIGYLIGIIGDVRLFYDFYLSLGLLFEQRGYDQQETILSLQTIKSTVREYRLNIPVQLKYIYPGQVVRPFFSGGFSYHYLLRAEADLQRFSDKPAVDGIALGVPFATNDYNITSLMNRSTYNWLLSAGIQVPVRGLYLFEFRVTYERGVNNLINPDNRYSDQTLLSDYAYVPDDVKVSSWMFTLLFTRNFTKPLKK